MKATRACAALLACVAVQAAEPWSTQDLGLEVAYALALTADWAQTRDIARHPHCYERNGLIGRRPSATRVNGYFLLSMALHVGVVHVLPSKWRPAYQAATLGFELACVGNNARLGIRINF